MRRPEAFSEPTPEAQQLSELYKAARNWQSYFKRYPNQSQTEELRDEAIQELDALWPYYDQPVYFSGLAFVPNYDDEGNYAYTYSTNAALEAISRGFTVVDASLPDSSEGSQPVLMHECIVAVERGQPDPHVRYTKECVIYFAFDYSTYLPLRGLHAIEGGLESGSELDMNALGLNLRRKARRLENRLLDGQFKNLSTAQQLAGLDKRVQAATRRLPLGMPMGISAEHALALDANGQTVIVNVSDAMLEGQALGAVFFERTDIENDTFYRDGRAPDRIHGLCIAFDVDHVVRPGYGLDDKNMLFVPLASQDIEFSA